MPIPVESLSLIETLFQKNVIQSTPTPIESAVIDTNVALDILYWNDKEAQALKLALIEGRIRLVLDKEALLELAEVISRSSFHLTLSAQIALLKQWSDDAQLIDAHLLEEAQKTTIRCKDPLDQKFIVLSIATLPTWLVTKDKLVLKTGKKLKRFGINTLTPRDWSLIKD